MAVTKIHRASKMALIIGVIVSLIVMGLFYLGGQVPVQEKIAPLYDAVTCASVK